MKMFYFRRIERARRTRLRVAVEDTTVTIFLVSYCQAGKSDLPGTWSLEEKTFDLSMSGQSAEYHRLIAECECCPSSEYKSAFSEAVKANNHPASLICRYDSRLTGYDRSKKATNNDYPIPTTVLIQKIDDFFNGAGKHQA